MSNTAVWKSVLGEIEIGLSQAVFQTWFKNTHISNYSEKRTEIAVANIFTKNQLEHKFKKQIIELLTKHGLETSEVIFTIDTSKLSAPSKQARPFVKEKKGTVITKPKLSTPNNTSGLNPKYTFDNYIVGSSNELAYAACLASASDPGNKYNPLFIYGGVGLGKTHLMQAVGNKVVSENPNMKILYISSESFIREFVKSIRNKKAFGDVYRTADVLIIDDIQFIGSAEKTQEEFFHTFNQLHQHNKQIIMSCDKQPKSIPGLTERLQSRFEWGMTIDIQQPDYETRCAILQAKASSSGFELPQDTTEYLAANIQTNIRELEGSLNQLIAFCEIRSLSPTLETAKALLANVRVRPKHISVRDVVTKVAKHFDIQEADIKGPKRDKSIVIPRQVAMYLLRSELHLSFPKIAKELGRKDHTTAMHSVEKIEKSLYTDNLVRQNVNEIKDILYA